MMEEMSRTIDRIDVHTNTHTRVPGEIDHLGRVCILASGWANIFVNISQTWPVLSWRVVTHENRRATGAAAASRFGNADV